MRTTGNAYEVYRARPINKEAGLVRGHLALDDQPMSHAGEIFCVQCREWVNNNFFLFHVRRIHPKLATPDNRRRWRIQAARKAKNRKSRRKKQKS